MGLGCVERLCIGRKKDSPKGEEESLHIQDQETQFRYQAVVLRAYIS